MEELPCIKCGAAPAAVSGLCESCFKEDADLCAFPASVKLTVCSNCGAYAARSRWLRSSSVEDVIETRIREASAVRPGVERLRFTFGYNWTDRNQTIVEVSLSGSVDGVMLEESGTVTAKIKYGVCDACSRRSGSYFEAIIQLRASMRKIDDDEKERAEEIIGKMVEKAAGKDDGAFITRAEAVRGGYDYYLSQRALGESISRELTGTFGAAHRSSPAMAGRKDGKDQYRITHIVRLPPYRTGDFIDLSTVPQANVRKGAPPFMIVSITAHYILIRQLLTGDERKLHRKELENVTIIARREDVQRAVVVSEGKELIQMMHPSSYKTVDVNRPGYDVVVKDGTTEVLVVDDVIFILFGTG